MIETRKHMVGVVSVVDLMASTRGRLTSKQYQYTIVWIFCSLLSMFQGLLTQWPRLRPHARTHWRDGPTPACGCDHPVIEYSACSRRRNPQVL
jgi:hypothetical protein